jgi:ribose transport system ATP-binding protein
MQATADRSAGRVALATLEISKHFPGVQALDRVSLEVREGEVHALVGANGAGKSTLINILSGYFPPDSGQIVLNGAPVSFHSPGESLHKGIVTVHQEIDIAGGLTVAQNIFLGNEKPFKRAGFIDRRRMNAAAADALGQLGIRIDPATPVRRLSTGSQQLVMIASALVRKARVMIFDEPTSALSGREIECLFSQIRELRRSGVAVIYISHYLDDICEIADRATVLRDGKMVGVLDLKDCGKIDLIRLMIGHDVQEVQRSRSWATGQEVLRVDGLSTRDGRVGGVSFTLFKGEVLGFFGAIGAGRSELARAIFMGEGVAGGEVFLDGQRIANRDARDALQRGIVYSPEDRKSEGLLLDLSVIRNITLSILRRVSTLGIIRQREANAIAAGYVVQLNIATPSIHKEVRQLSGGNQQKVVLSKGLATEADILILDEPTVGIDVGTKEEILEIILGLARSGKSVMLISSESSELMKVCDRIIVMRQGKVQREMQRSQFDKEQLLDAAVGGTA